MAINMETTVSTRLFVAGAGACIVGIMKRQGQIDQNWVYIGLTNEDRVFWGISYSSRPKARGKRRTPREAARG